MEDLRQETIDRVLERLHTAREESLEKKLLNKVRNGPDHGSTCYWSGCVDALDNAIIQIVKLRYTNRRDSDLTPGARRRYFHEAI